MPPIQDHPLPTGPSNNTTRFFAPMGTYINAPCGNFNNNRTTATNNAPFDPAASTANSASNSNRSTTSATGTTGQATSSNQSNGMSAQSSTPNSRMNTSQAPRTQQPLVQPFVPTRPVNPCRRIGHVGDGGLPMFPSHVMPLNKKEITIEYCSKPEVFAHYWILDSKQRTNGRNTNMIDKTDAGELHDVY